MKAKVSYIIGLIFFFIGDIYAQEKHIGITAGIVTEHLFNKSRDKSLYENGYLFGLQAEYVPNKAMFSITTGIQYLSINESIMIPVNLNILFGKKFKFKIYGGLIPFFRLKPVAPEKTLSLSEQVGLSIEYKIHNKYTLFSDFGIFFIPELSYYYSHFGDKSTIRSTNHYQHLNIGIKYLL